jgi:hypothetical protein
MIPLFSHTTTTTVTKLLQAVAHAGRIARRGPSYSRSCQVKHDTTSLTLRWCMHSQRPQPSPQHPTSQGCPHTQHSTQCASCSPALPRWAPQRAGGACSPRALQAAREQQSARAPHRGATRAATTKSRARGRLHVRCMYTVCVRVRLASSRLGAPAFDARALAAARCTHGCPAPLSPAPSSGELYGESRHGGAHCSGHTLAAAAPSGPHPLPPALNPAYSAGRVPQLDPSPPARNRQGGPRPVSKPQRERHAGERGCWRHPGGRRRGGERGGPEGLCRLSHSGVHRVNTRPNVRS